MGPIRHQFITGDNYMSMMGKTLNLGWRFPDIETVYMGSGSDVLVSDAQELDMAVDDITISNDLKARQYTLAISSDVSWSEADFNGMVLSDVHDVLNPIASVTFTSNIASFDLSRLSFTEDRLEINFAGLPVSAGDYVTVTIAFEINRVKGTSGNDLLTGRGDEDMISGGAGNDVLRGLADNDRLYGGTGADRLYGGDGDDILRSMQGNDKMWGGTGADTFVYSSGSGKDRIKDFETGIDKIDIRKWATIDDFADLKSHARNRGDDLWIIDGKNALIIEDFSKADLVKADFLI